MQEQIAQLAQFKILSESNQSYELPFLTREQIDAEKKGLETKVRALTEAVKNKDQKLTDLQTESMFSLTLRTVVRV